MFEGGTRWPTQYVVYRSKCLQVGTQLYGGRVWLVVDELLTSGFRLLRKVSSPCGTKLNVFLGAKHYRDL